MIQSTINAFGNALSGVFSFIPRLVGFLVILFVGWLVGIAVGKVVTALLRKVGFERLSTRIGMTNLERRMGMRIDSAQLLGRVVFWFIFLLFLVPATDALGLPTVSSTLTGLVDYIPNIFVAILVLFLGTLLGVFVGDIIRGTTTASKMGNPDLLGNIARWAIIGFSCLIALEQLQIAPAMITVLFTAIVGGLALAFGLSFGLGGRESAQRLLSRSEGKLVTSRPYDPNQIVQQAHGDLAHTEQVGQAYTPQASPTAPPAYGSSVPGSQQTISPTSQTYDDSGYNNPTTPPQRPPQRPSTPRS
ncbi:MAG TPA: hypothetical protein VGM01_02960 [Ktedonobacteraceae bacterium]|jgi:hypothetical protein